MMDIEKLVQASSLEELNAAAKVISQRRKEMKKSVVPAALDAALIGLENTYGRDALKLGYAGRRKVWKTEEKNKAEADLAGLADDEDDDEAADERAAA
jgi:hypothetical protein